MSLKRGTFFLQYITPLTKHFFVKNMYNILEGYYKMLKYMKEKEEI